MRGGRFAIACARCLRILQTADGGAPVVTWLSSRRGNRGGELGVREKGLVVRGLARDDEARKLCPKGLELCFPGTNGRFAYNTADGVLNPLLNEVSLSKEWGAVAAFVRASS